MIQRENILKIHPSASKPKFILVPTHTCGVIIAKVFEEFELSNLDQLEQKSGLYNAALVAHYGTSINVHAIRSCISYPFDLYK